MKRQPKRQARSRRPTPGPRAASVPLASVRPGQATRQTRQATPTNAAARAAADRSVAQGATHHRAGRLQEAEACYRQALALTPDHPEALHLLGLLAHQVGRADLALGLIQQAISHAADRPTYHLNHGAVLRALGRLDDAVTAWRRALALRPAYPEAFNNLGVALQALGRLDEAIPCFERAAALAPAYADAHFNLGVARQAEGRPDRAIICYEAALAAHPKHAAARYNLGNALREMGRYSEAADAYRAVLALEPGHVDAQNNLGVALQELGDRDEAIACFRRTIELQADYPQAHTNLAHLLRDRGRFAEAIQEYRQALVLQPDDAQAHSGLIFVLDHHQQATPADRLAERRAWNERHARPLTLAARPHQNDRDPDRPLRVGYVSGDFYYHSAAAGFAPVILAHDPRQVEVYCYATIARSDAQTSRIAQAVPVWRDVTHLSDEAVAEQIRADGIDILVDLGGHSASGRLLIFARQPAPIQVTAWGYITGTGLDAMQYLFADPVVLPPESERWYGERVVHLPSVVCYEPPSMVPDVAPAPILERGAVTFGSFNRPTKLSDEALALWARVLATVPHSRMVLKSPGLDDAENRERILAAFARQGVSSDRIDILGQTPIREHLEAYGRIDVQLDPFPHVGGATTYDSLLQGVPCITLLGELIQGRLSASFLTSVGLSDLIARTPEEYVEIARRLAADPERLVRERATLRQRVLASPFADVLPYTRAVEQAYRTMWQRWCDLTPPTRHPTMGPLDPHGLSGAERGEAAGGGVGAGLDRAGMPNGGGLGLDVDRVDTWKPAPTGADVGAGFQQPPAASPDPNLPHSPEWGQRGVQAYQAGRFEEARDCFIEVTGLAPDDAEAWTNLGAAQLQLGQYEQAEASQRRAVSLHPDLVAAQNNLGNVLVAQSRWQDAAPILDGVTRRAPDDANGWINYGHTLKGLQRHREAQDAYARALSIRPDDVVALVGLGDALQGQDHLVEAVGYYQRAVALRPDDPEPHEHLAIAYQGLGQLDAAAASFRACLALDPERARVHSGLIFILDLQEGAEAESLAERARWNARFGRSAHRTRNGHQNRPDPDRPLRVGYVSADFRHHSAAYTLLPVLRGHDRARFSIYGYSGVTAPDRVTEQIRALMDGWRETTYLSDDALDALIRADEIDVLVDLSGHSGGNRLPVFAREPAPVQVTAWGYAAGTGLDAMHYFLADPIAVPPDALVTYTEQVVNLPAVLCYDPPPYAPPVAPLPASTRGSVTFGAFNRLPKITDDTLVAWGRVLTAIPDARLVVKCGGADRSPMRDELLERMARSGLDTGRVTLLGGTPHPDHLAAHGEIDVMLDTFPQSGGITTLDALLMGVPVVTLLGQRVPGRVSASLLSALGLQDLVASTPDGYVEITARLAGDLGRLTRERRTLRDRLLGSPIADAQQYARAVEEAYREMWRRWCVADLTPPEDDLTPPEALS